MRCTTSSVSIPGTSTLTRPFASLTLGVVPETSSAALLSFLPAGKTFGKARLLVADRDAKATLADGRVIVEVPGIETIEVVHLTWA